MRDFAANDVVFPVIRNQDAQGGEGCGGGEGHKWDRKGLPTGGCCLAGWKPPLFVEELIKAEGHCHEYA